MAGSERVGIVVPIPEPHASRLSAVRAVARDPYASVPPHLTLVTGIPVGDWNEVLEHVSGVAADAEPFRITVRGTATFRPVTPVVYARVVDGAAECSALHARLLRGPLAAPPAYPYVPHVTLAQGLDDAALDRVMAQEAQEAWELSADRLCVYGDLGDEDWKLRATVPLGE